MDFYYFFRGNLINKIQSSVDDCYKISNILLKHKLIKLKYTLNNQHSVDLIQHRPQTTQTAHTLYLDRLSRPIVSRHAMLRFHLIFLTDISRPLVAFRGFTTF